MIYTEANDAFYLRPDYWGGTTVGDSVASYIETHPDVSTYYLDPEPLRKTNYKQQKFAYKALLQLIKNRPSGSQETFTDGDEVDANDFSPGSVFTSYHERVELEIEPTEASGLNRDEANKRAPLELVRTIASKSAYESHSPNAPSSIQALHPRYGGDLELTELNPFNQFSFLKNDASSRWKTLTKEEMQIPGVWTEFHENIELSEHSFDVGPFSFNSIYKYMKSLLIVTRDNTANINRFYTPMRKEPFHLSNHKGNPTLLSGMTMHVLPAKQPIGTSLPSNDYLGGYIDRLDRVNFMSLDLEG